MACTSPYIVKSGDTLSKIAARCGVSVQALINANAAGYPSLRTNPNQLRIGWLLTIPGAPSQPNQGTTGIDINQLLQQLQNAANQTIVIAQPQAGQTYDVKFTISSGFPRFGWSNLRGHAESLRSLLSHEFDNVSVDVSGTNNTGGGVVWVTLKLRRSYSSPNDIVAVVNRAASGLVSVDQNPSSFAISLNSNTGNIPTDKKPDPNNAKSIWEILSDSIFNSLGIVVSANTVAAIVVGGVLIMWFTRD